MTLRRPNAWTTYDDDATTQLTYAVQTNPAPLTTSIPNQDPVLASCEVVITNLTGADVDVQSVVFTVQVGAGSGGTLMPTTEGVLTDVSDTTDWTFLPPASTVTSGPAAFTLSPATGDAVTLAANASVTVQFYQFATLQSATNTTVTVKEIVTGSAPGFLDIGLTTFPDGFYFDSLTATVQVGSTLVPVAQVANPTNITLVWNASVVDVSQVTIYYSDPVNGQQTATPTSIGLWTTLNPITADTVFAVVVTAETTGGEPIAASLSTTVSVQNPALVATSLTTSGNATIGGSGTFAGPLTAGAVTASGLSVTGAATIGQQLTAAAGASVTGALSVGNALTVGNGLTLQSGGNTVAGISSSGVASLAGLAIGNGAVNMMQIQGLFGNNVALTTPTDGFALAMMSPPPGTSTSVNYIKIASPLGGQVAFGGIISGVSIPGYLCVPVQAGWTVTFSYTVAGSNAGTAFFFFAAQGQRVGA